MSADAQTLLLEQLAGGASINDVIAQISETDPRIGMVAQYLARKRAVEEAQENDDGEPRESETEVRRSVTQLSPEGIAAVQSLQRMARSMYAELEELRERNDTLASALGACYLCWGEDFECEVCHGRGQPGSLLPDRTLFSELVAPAVRRLRNPPAQPSGEPARQARSVTEPTVTSTRNPN